MKKIEHSGDFIKDRNGKWWNIAEVTAFEECNGHIKGYVKDQEFYVGDFENIEESQECLDALMISIGYGK